MSSRASVPRCQGLAPSELQPLMTAIVRATSGTLHNLIFIAIAYFSDNEMRKPSLWLGKQLAYLRLVRCRIHRLKTDMPKALHTVTVDEHARRHSGHFELLSQSPTRIETHIEARIKAAQKSIPIRPV